MFITLEGPDGSGKTSQIPALEEFLRQKGYDVVVTREPGGTDVGDQIRDILMNLKNTAIVPRTEILLFQAARAQHVEEVINPALAAGKVVICDRFGDSTLAYQGYGHPKINLEKLRYLVNYATGGLKPDLTLFLDVPIKEGLARKLSQSEWNRLDAYAEGFHRRVYQGYMALVSAEPDRWCVIDATQSKDEVQQAMREAILDRLSSLD
ncbi:MAG: dTMP kinase [Chloroflexota bacterium]|nr:dTMP kinase [Chloroflexota bacterium]